MSIKHSELRDNSVGPWTPIDETSPIGRVVLIAYGTGMIAIAKYERHGPATGWHMGDGRFAFRPTHWMPLPLLPQCFTNDAATEPK